VQTKCDLARGAAALNAFPCSSITGEGLDQLAAEIRRRLDERPTAGAAMTAARCTASLHAADAALAAAAELAGAGGDELLAAEIRTALTAIGEVVGAVCADDLLDRVFSQFCIGK
jgi:tRNA modification GTPase